MYNDAKEEIRSKLAIEDVIGEYVQLKRSGRYWKGLSPFTNERTPSFFVTPDRDIWHDFSSGKGGDIFSFVMEMEGVDFRGALEILARKAGVDLSKYQSAGARSLAARKERIYQMNNLAVNYYQRQLIQSPTAMDYVFKTRRLAKETVVEWGVGYAPMRPDLEQILVSKGYSKQEMREAGLLGYSGRELFFNRMMIPLRDRKGQIVGFTGRIVGSGEPKYLNTPDTILYHKGQQLFGLNFATQAIRKQGFSVIVEGNLDVITSHQAGIKNVVGVAGTALTAEHLKSLSRLSNDVRFCFDGDKAGVAATEKAIRLAGPLELKLSVIDYSGNGAKDPDELIHLNPDLWRQALDNYQPAVNWVRDYYVKTVGIDSVDGKKVVSDKTLDVIRSLTDPVEQEGYVRELAKITGISVVSLMERLKMLTRQAEQPPRRRLKQSKIAKKQTVTTGPTKFRYLDSILAYLVANPNLRQKYSANMKLDSLDANDRAVCQLLSNSLASGDEIIDQLGEAMDDGNKADQDVANMGQLRDRLVQLQMINDQAQSSITGIKGESDLLDYLCHYEHDYYIRLSKELMIKSVNANQSVGSDELAKLAESSRAARRLAEQLDPGRNRRNNYQGLRNLWQQRQKTEPARM